MAVPAYVTGSLNSGTSVSSLASGSCTPTAGAVVDIVICNTFAGAANRPTIASGTGWASSISPTLIEGSDNAANRITVYSFTVGGSPTAGTVTADCAGQSQQGLIVYIMERTGTNETPVEVGTAFANSAAASATLDTTPPSGSNTQVAALYYVATGTITPGTGYTEMDEQTLFGAVKVQIQYDESAPSDGVADATLGSAANWAMVTYEVEASGGDVTAPVLSSPTDASTGPTTGSGSVSTDEGNGTLYHVVTTSATPPSAAQVKAGQDHTGSAAVDSGSQAVSGTGVQNISGGFTGLDPATQHYAHYMHEDAATNQSSVSSADGFTTATISAALTGTIASGATETDIVDGGQTAILTLTNDTWVAAGATFNAQRQAIIDGFDAATSPTNGWNNEVRDKAAVTEVVRTSSTVVTVTFAAQAGYSIDSTETITVTIPAAALVTSGDPVEADSTFQIAADGVTPSALPLVNAQLLG